MTPIENNYIFVLTELKNKIKQAKTKAALSVNFELLKIYWEIGTTIITQQLHEKWGTKIIDRLSADLKAEFSDMQGLSVRNIKYMRAFAEAYPNFPIVQPALAQIQNTNNQLDTIVQAPLAQLTWYHHITLLDKIKEPEIRLFYIHKTIENGWSRNVMVHQIESKLHDRQGALTNNFKETIPNYSSELTQQLFKDPYNFDFLALSEKAKEQDLENALINHVTKMLLELGDGFAFMGRQYLLKAGEKEYFLDLLFYHTKLRRHVVIELKIGDFMPEYVGKMNLYLGLADDTLKNEHDQPAIGLILCKTKDKIVAEYALRDTSKPIGIAEYKINQLLPEDIKSELPSIEEIEQKLDEEIENTETPLKEGIDKIKSLIANLKKGKVEKRLDSQVTLQLFNDVLVTLYSKLKNQLKGEIEPLFESVEILIHAGTVGYEIEKIRQDLNNLTGQIHNLKLDVRLRGFKAAGEDAFNITNDIIIDLEDYKYICRFAHENKTQYVKLYHQLFSDEELNTIVITFCKTLMDEIVRKLEQIKD